MLLIILLVLISLLLISVFWSLSKIQKKIWQKIDVIYNQIYLMMIEKYYNLDYWKKLLKEEMLDYVNNVVLESNLGKRISYVAKFKSFFEKLLSTDRWLINQVNMYENYYKSLMNIKIIIILSVFVLIIVALSLIYLNLKY